MADTTRNIWNDNGGERVAPRPKKKHWKGVLSFLLILLVVLFVMLLAAYRDGTGFDVLRRYLHYGSSERSTEESVYDYDGGASMRFAAVEDVEYGNDSITVTAVLDAKVRGQMKKYVQGYAEPQEDDYE